MTTEVPDYLMKYKRTPEEILDGRVLPPVFPKGAKKPVRTKATQHMIARKYSSPEAMRYAIDLYFESLFKIDEDGVLHRQKWPTIPGLVLALGFDSRTTLDRYREKPEFKQLVDWAYTRVEEQKNDLLLQGGSTTTAALADLKWHHKWSDRVEHNVAVSEDSLTALVQALQGNVLRPVLNVQQEDIEDAEIVEEAEEYLPQPISPEEYIEDGEIVDDLEDLI